MACKRKSDAITTNTGSCLTAHAVEGMREKCIASGMNDFLAKPFSYEEITAKVMQWTRANTGPSTTEHNVDQKQQHDAADSDKSEQRHIDESRRGQSRVSVLDLKALDQLRARQKYRKKGLVKKVVGLYLEQTPKLLEELVTARSVADTEALVNIAHTLKSSSLIVGATALADTCREIEEMGVQGKVEDTIIDRVPQQYSAVEKDLQSILSNEE